MKFLLISAVAVALAACGGPTGRPVSYTKSAAEAQGDTYFCREQAGITGGGGGFIFGPLILVAPVALLMAADKSSKEKVYLDCMRDRGYEIKPVAQ